MTLLAVSPDQRTLATCNQSGRIRLWDLRTNQYLYELDCYPSGFRWLGFTADSQELVGIDIRLAEHHWSSRPTPAIQIAIPDHLE